jgi:Putative prokaryotic signal transducing protein
VNAPPHGEGELTAVLHTADATLVPVVRSLLDSAEIPYLLQGEEGVGMLPLGRFGGGVFEGNLGVIVLVPAERAEEARALLESVPRDPESFA